MPFIDTDSKILNSVDNTKYSQEKQRVIGEIWRKLNVFNYVTVDTSHA